MLCLDILLPQGPYDYERVKKEVRDVYTSMDEITAQATSKLPYLHAVVQEALRLHPAGPVSVPRVVDRPGVMVSGCEIPVGVRSILTDSLDRSLLQHRHV